MLISKSLRSESVSRMRAFSTSAGFGEKIGFIGLGDLGSRMVNNILSSTGHEVIACDQSSAVLHAAQSAGAETTSSPAALASAEDTRVVISLLPSASAVRDAYLGSDGIVKAKDGIKPSLFIDCSTISPAVSREIASEVRVGGSREAAKAAEPYLKMLGRSVLYCGLSGTGQTAKVCVDMALAVQMASVAESMAFGMELGLEPKALAAILNASASRCWSSTNYNPVPGVMEGVPAARGYKGGFTAKDMMEHLAAAIASQEILGPNLPMAEKALELYTQVATKHPDEDFSSIYKHVYAKGSA